MKRIAFGTMYLVFVLVLGLFCLTGGSAVAGPGVDHIWYDYGPADAWTHEMLPVGAGTAYSAITMDINENNRLYAAKSTGGIDQYYYSGGYGMESIASTAGTVYTAVAPTHVLHRFGAARADGGIEHIYESGDSWLRYLIEPSAGIAYNSITMDTQLTNVWRFYASKATGGIDVYQLNYDPNVNSNVWVRSSVSGLTTVYNAIAADRATAGIVLGARQDGGVDRINAGADTWSPLDVGNQVYTALSAGRGESYWTMYGAKAGAGGVDRMVNFGNDIAPNFGVYEIAPTAGLVYSGLTTNEYAYNLYGTVVVPEPSSIVALASMGALGLLRRKRRSGSSAQ